MQKIAAVMLKARVHRIFAAAGASEEEAGLVAHQLVEANLVGHDSHGVGLVGRYLDNIRDGTLLLNRSLDVALDTGGMLICDAGLGAGQSLGRQAIELGIARARQSGSCLVSLRNSHHLGRIGHWAEMCTDAGLVSVHFVNVVADPVVTVYGGTKGRLGTNPFAAGFPDPEGGDPVIVDFATSELALGKIKVAHMRGRAVPPGVLLDGAGHPTTDPAVMFQHPMGCLLSLGAHKGSGLALVCELLGAAVVGAPVQSGPASGTAIVNSMMSVLIDPAVLGTVEAYAAQFAAIRGWLLSENDEGGAVMLPGTPERLSRAKRSREGIEVEEPTLARLRMAEETLGLAPASGDRSSPD